MLYYPGAKQERSRSKTDKPMISVNNWELHMATWRMHIEKGIRVKTYWPKERNTSKLTKYQLNKLRKNV